MAPELLARATAQAADLAYLYNIGYLVLFPPIPERYPYANTWQESWSFLKSTLPLEPAPFWASDGIEAYRVVQPAGSDRFDLDLGVAGTDPYRGEGWDSVEVDSQDGAAASWATATESQLFVPLRKVHPLAKYMIRLRVQPYRYPGAPPQQVSLAVNGAPLGEQLLSDGWQDVRWVAPGAVLVDGLNRLNLKWAYAEAPRKVAPGDRLIGSTGVELPIDADLKGFADGGFIALFDEAGQQMDASAGRHGVNVTVLDPQSGAVREAAGFDTTANTYESEALVDFLGKIEPGSPVLVVSYGDATRFLTAEAVTALRGIGADVTLEGLKGRFFALAGVQGAKAGSAALVIDPQDAFLRISHNRDRRTLAAAVDTVQLGPAEQ